MALIRYCKNHATNPLAEAVFKFFKVHTILNGPHRCSKFYAVHLMLAGWQQIYHRQLSAPEKIIRPGSISDLPARRR